MAHRHTTPPMAFEVDPFDARQWPSSSASSRASHHPNDWSPATAMTTATTPDKSPVALPCVDYAFDVPFSARGQLQPPLIDPGRPQYPYVAHSRNLSLPDKNPKTSRGGTLSARDTTQRRSLSPYVDAYMVPAPYEYMTLPNPSSCRPSSSSTSSSGNYHVRPTHVRTPSSSSIDASMLNRYGYPTYRQTPTTQIVTPRSTTAVNHLAPTSLSRSNVQAPSITRRSASPLVKPSRPSVNIEIPDDDDLAQSNMLEYLSMPSPIPQITQSIVDVNKNNNTHFWFDIRNIRKWSDFSVETITRIPNLLRLLTIDVPAKRLPIPGKVNLNIETAAQLAQLCANYHAVKVNAALRVTLGERHIAMRALSSVSSVRQQPEFVANYLSDVEKTIFGDGRGRVVGIVKCSKQWNSGMGGGSVIDKICYFRHLAHLHRFMREHGTRYGFIATEVEVVCVRAGGPPAPDNVPWFGYLEVAEPVHVATCRSARDGTPNMTADLALWYLHMLAKDQPFTDHFHWRVDVGAPAALTRQKHLARDEDLPEPTIKEKRKAKQTRGWVWPDEPLSKRECGRGKRSRA